MLHARLQSLLHWTGHSVPVVSSSRVVMCLAVLKYESVLERRRASARKVAGAHPPRRLDDDGDGQVHVVRVHQAHLHTRQPMRRHQQHVPDSGLIVQSQLSLELSWRSSSRAAASERARVPKLPHKPIGTGSKAQSPVCPRAHRYAGVARKGGVHGVVRQHLRCATQFKRDLSAYSTPVILDSTDRPDIVRLPMPYCPTAGAASTHS